MSPVDPLDLCQIDIPAKDPGTALQFYQHVFGWKPTSADILGRIVLEVPRSCPYGISIVRGSPSPGVAPIRLYFKTKHAKDIAELAMTYGAQVSWLDAEGYGNIAVITDPEGHQWGLFTP